MRRGATMMRFGSKLYLTPALVGLIMITVLSLGAIVVRVMPEHSGVRTPPSPENGGRATLDIGVADLRGSLP
jgi:hypothetical protein